MVIAPILRTINKGISSGIGLAGEKYHDHKDRKAALAEQKQKEASYSTSEVVNSVDHTQETIDDEQLWALDEAAGLPDYETSQAQQRLGVERTISDLVRDVAVTQENEVQERTEFPTRLPYPVIIPQRRPGTKGRGFARAYPPDLERFGIEQDTFMHFLQNFEDVQQASPWLKTIYLAGNIVGLVPGTITMAVSFCVSAAVG